ncbi:unnamed protein product [Rhizophagus irregularis]|uniref:Ion transport domain-containing protein n=1 Tax=Rhizophagus irregularis TaxID=588596 RepID=A0A2N1N4J8_9GLOM|nr:hypothetical protein RhiirC2_781773 [Rhizophagus irregularis]CAB4379754.1 unnamed protein product [Rhizophagus irregularis]
MTRDIECGDQTYGEKISYVAISPDGSIVATFNPYSSSILVTKVMTSETVTKIRFDRKKFFDKVPPKILGWSLAVSDIIDAENNIGLIAISCMTDEDMNPKLKILPRKLNRRIKKLFFYSLAISLLLVLTFWFLPLPLDVLFYCVFAYYCFYYVKYYVTDIRQLTWNSSKGMIKFFKFSFNNINNNAANNVMTNSYMNNNSDTPIYKYCLGGVVSFLKNSKNSSNYATLVCMNCIKIQTIDIKLNKLNINIITREEGDCILPENLYKELESINDAKHNWIYLLKSRYQEFLMVVTNEYQQTQNIEIYNINTSQLVNVFHRVYGDEDFLVLNNHSKPGIFAISTDSRLFAYSYGNNIITIYLMESGLKVVSKRFNNIHKIKFLEFIAKDRKLFIIEEDKEHDVKFHIWIISGCLNDYFSISKEDIGLSDNDISTLLKYDGYYHILTKANGKIVTLENDNEDQFRVLSDIFTKSDIFKENDSVIDEFKYDYSHDNLEPWNNNAGSIRSIRGKFLDNDKSLLYLIGKNSIQIWKSKSQTFKDFEDFKSFENSNLVYILISDSIKPAKLQIDDDMITIITHACKSLTYLYNHKHVKNIEKHQKFVSGIINIIKDFIKRNPDNWKLMEVQYPLMAYLIYSRSFSLIKYILFGVNDQISSQKKNVEILHRPQNKYVSYPYYNDLKLYDDLKFKNDNLKSANDLELALKFCQDRDAVMLAYLLEYYSENSMDHIGWMINVTKILPELPANYAELLYYKPCFGGIKYNFPIRRFKELPVSDDTLDLKVSLPITRLKATKSLSFLKYKIIGDEELHNIYMVPLPNFVTHGTEIKEKSRVKFGTIYYWLRKILLPPGYKNLNDRDFSPFLRINKKNKSAFFNVPVVEAVITSRWEQTKNYWMTPLLIYSTFLAIFAYLPPFFLDGNDELGGSIYIINLINMGIFYYAGLYLLIAEFMQMKKYKTEYFTLFNIFDLCSILLGIIVFTLIIVKSFDETNRINGEGIVILMTVTTLILWIEMLFWLRLFSKIAIYIYIFGNILRKIIPFFAFMFILTIGVGHSMLVFFGYPSLLNLNPTASNFTLNNGTGNFTLTGENPNNPFDTIWDAILSAYYWNAINLSPYNYWPLKLFSFFANIILVLVLLNMIIALMNDTFNKAKEDGKLGLLMYRVELINDYERLNDPFFSVSLNNKSSYICFYRNPDLMKKWITKSQELKDIKLYSWYNENVDKEVITFDNENDTINLWYALITGNKNQNSASSLSIPDHMTLWF